MGTIMFQIALILCCDAGLPEARNIGYIFDLPINTKTRRARNRVRHYAPDYLPAPVFAAPSSPLFTNLRTEQHARLRYVKAYYDGRTDPLVQTVPAKSSSSSSATNSSASSADPEGVAGER